MQIFKYKENNFFLKKKDLSSSNVLFESSKFQYFHSLQKHHKRQESNIFLMIALWELPLMH